MDSLARANMEAPHETRPFKAHGHMDVVTLGDFTLGRGVFEPGWRWSVDVKPIAGTESCQARHTGICIAGQMTVRAGAWTVGSEACVLYDTGVAAYAKPA
jgi:hypothetical protein